eukprot:SAG31_NODE_9117_length_1330_cov_8.642567_1_plen_62_part_10
MRVIARGLVGSYLTTAVNLVCSHEAYRVHSSRIAPRKQEVPSEEGPQENKLPQLGSGCKKRH